MTTDPVGPVADHAPTPEPAGDALAAPMPPTTTAAASKGDTDYVILLAESKTSFTMVGGIAAKSADAAVRQYAYKASNPDGTYVAIPSRSWRPVTIRTKTTTTLVVEEAS